MKAYNTDYIKRKDGFIDKDKILQFVTEEEIFELVFGFQPTEFGYVTSPFRVDNNPGCWFEYSPSNGKLRFVDFGNDKTINGIKLLNIDCFDAVQVYYNLKNLFEVLSFIKKHLIEGKERELVVKKALYKPTLKKEVKILVNTRDFNSRDKNYWQKYGISKQNLIEDKVFPLNTFKMFNTKKGDIYTRCYDIAYAYTAFSGGRKKIYRPFQKLKFMTNCIADNIGELNSLIPFGRQLVISKSYKDCRVLKNEGLNSIWFQNEGMIPSEEILIPLCKRFDDVIIFFDNDAPGIAAANKVNDYINSFLSNKSRSLSLPIIKNVTDPSDLYKERSKSELTSFLVQKNLIR